LAIDLAKNSGRRKRQNGERSEKQNTAGTDAAKNTETAAAPKHAGRIW
jgi:hypothetical protein